MKLTCKHCGDAFTADSEDMKLLENGEISEITPVCDECFSMQGNEDFSYMDYSDADNGL